MFGAVVHDIVNRVYSDIVRMLRKTSGRSNGKFGKIA
jgi:hypothetical protein